MVPASEFLTRCLAERNLILNASAVLWRRSALLAAFARCGGEVDGLRVAGDWRLYAEVLSGGGQVVYVAEPLNIHRRHEASATRRLAPEHHLAEVTRMHRLMAGRLGDDAGLRARQLRYQRRVRAELAGD